MFCEQTCCLISCVCAFAVITEDLKTNNVWDNVGGLDGAELLRGTLFSGSEVQVLVF